MSFLLFLVGPLVVLRTAPGPPVSMFPRERGPAAAVVNQKSMPDEFFFRRPPKPVCGVRPRGWWRPAMSSSSPWRSSWRCRRASSSGCKSARSQRLSGSNDVTSNTAVDASRYLCRPPDRCVGVAPADEAAPPAYPGRRLDRGQNTKRVIRSATAAGFSDPSISTVWRTVRLTVLSLTFAASISPDRTLIRLPAVTGARNRTLFSP